MKCKWKDLLQDLHSKCCTTTHPPRLLDFFETIRRLNSVYGNVLLFRVWALRTDIILLLHMPVPAFLFPFSNSSIWLLFIVFAKHVYESLLTCNEFVYFFFLVLYCCLFLSTMDVQFESSLICWGLLYVSKNHLMHEQTHSRQITFTIKHARINSIYWISISPASYLTAIHARDMCRRVYVRCMNLSSIFTVTTAQRKSIKLYQSKARNRWYLCLMIELVIYTYAHTHIHWKQIESYSGPMLTCFNTRSTNVQRFSCATKWQYSLV